MLWLSAFNKSTPPFATPSTLTPTWMILLCAPAAGKGQQGVGGPVEHPLPSIGGKGFPAEVAVFVDDVSTAHWPVDRGARTRKLPPFHDPDY